MGKNADFSQFEKFCKNWQDAYKDFDDFLRKFLLEMAQRALGNTGGIVDNTPKDTGALRASWHIADVVVAGSDLHVTITNQQDYASFVEFGHRRWQDNAWVDGYFMMTVGIDRINQQMPLRFQKAFQNYLKEKGAT